MYQEVPIFDLSGGPRGFAMWRLTTPRGGTCLTATGPVTCFRIDRSGQSITDGDPPDCLDTGFRAAEAARPSVSQRIKRLLTPRNPDAGVDVTGTAVEPSSPEDELPSIDAWRSDVGSREPRGTAPERAPLRAWWSPTAIIETLDGASLVAATVLEVSGPVTSASGSDVPALLASRAWAVKLVTASRTQALRSLGVATAGSVAAAARLRRPGGPLPLLPAVWGFVHRVLDGP